MKLRHEVLKIDVGAALQVLNFAIFHKELTDMEDREQRETEKQQDAGAGGDNVDGPGGASGGNDVHGRLFSPSHAGSHQKLSYFWLVILS